jgi:hypothetical protein
MRWAGRLRVFFLAMFALEIGLFLLVYPWLPTWDLNNLPGFFPPLRSFWNESYLRSALSTLGLLNLYIALLQVIRLIRGQ